MRRTAVFLLLLQLVSLLHVASSLELRGLADLKDGVGDEEVAIDGEVSDDQKDEEEVTAVSEEVADAQEDAGDGEEAEVAPDGDVVDVVDSLAALNDDELTDDEEEAFEELREEEEQAILAIEEALEDHLDLVDVETAEPDEFFRVNSGGQDVQRLVAQFMSEYADEMSIMSLRADVVQVLRAEKTRPRPELQDKALDTNGMGDLDVDFVDEAVAEQYKILVLLSYAFQSSMLELKRPYVSVLQLVMDCTAADDCQTLEHVDLPRVNESTSSISPELQRAIFSAAPSAFASGSKHPQVLYDAVETQFLDDKDHSSNVMRYVRYRIQGGSAQDCMVVVQQTSNMNLLLYADSVCYEDPASGALAAAGHSKENFPMFVLIASFAGAIVAFVVLHYRRKYQRSGYSYVHSKPSKVPSVLVGDEDAAATA